MAPQRNVTLFGNILSLRCTSVEAVIYMFESCTFFMKVTRTARSLKRHMTEFRPIERDIGLVYLKLFNILAAVDDNLNIIHHKSATDSV